MIRVLLEVLESKNGGDLNHPYHSSYSQGDNIGGQAKTKIIRNTKKYKSRRSLK
jgi:hypothetical protein